MITYRSATDSYARGALRRHYAELVDLRARLDRELGLGEPPNADQNADIADNFLHRSTPRTMPI